MPEEPQIDNSNDVPPPPPPPVAPEPTDMIESVDTDAHSEENK